MYFEGGTMKEKNVAIAKLLTVEGICLLLAVTSVIAVTAFGGDGVVHPIADPEIPIWLKPIMDMIVALPVVGPIIIEILKWIGVIAALFTGVATLFKGVAKALKEIGKLAGFVEFSEKVQKFYDAIWPWLAWFSVYNVPKKR